MLRMVSIVHVLVYNIYTHSSIDFTCISESLQKRNIMRFDMEHDLKKKNYCITDNVRSDMHIIDEQLKS